MGWLRRLLFSSSEEHTAGPRARVPGFTRPEEPFELTAAMEASAARQDRRKAGAKAGRTFLVAHEAKAQQLSKAAGHKDTVRYARQKARLEREEAEYRRRNTERLSREQATPGARRVKRPTVSHRIFI